MKVTINYDDDYTSSGKNNPSTKGDGRYRYFAVGDDEGIKDFEKTQGQYFVRDKVTKKVIYNSVEYLGKQVPLVKRLSDGKWVPKIGAIDKMQAQAERWPFLANRLADKAIIAMERKSVTSTPIAVPDKLEAL